MLENRIENLENSGWGIVNLVLANGEKVNFEMSDGTEDAAAFEVVRISQYEENGYEVEGLELTTLEA